MPDPNWQKVPIPPGGSFIGWGQREGQYVEGEITAYDERGGKDFGGNICPQVEVKLTKPAASFNKRLERTDYAPGAYVTVTCGTTQLHKGIIAAEPERGDMIRIELDGITELDSGNTMKNFSIQIAHGTGAAKDAANVRVVSELGESAPADDDVPF